MNETIEQYVKFYRNLGLNVIPIIAKSKKPNLKEWKSWQTEWVPDETIEEWLRKGLFQNIGIICGKISGNLVVVEFDKRENYPKFFKRDIENETLVSESRRGFHVYLRSKLPLRSFKIKQLDVEIRSEGNFVVAPPSIHPSGHVYRFVNPEVKTILEVTDIKEAIWQKAEKLGVQRQESFLEFRDDPPCIKKILNGVEEGIRDECAIRLACYWLNNKNETVTICREMLERWNQRNKPPLEKKVLREKIASALRGGYEYGCNSMRQINICTPELEKTCSIKNRLSIKHLQAVYTPSAELSDGRLIEQGFDGENVYYIVFNPETAEVTKEEFVIDGNNRYIPIDNEVLRNGLVLLPSWAEEYETDEKLRQNIFNFLNYWHEQRDNFERELDLDYAFTSWVYDIIPQLAYRRALSRFGKGKSTWLEVLGCICNRPMILAGCATDAAIRRMFDTWRGTALIDEADFKDSTLYAVIIKILNIGWSNFWGYYHMADENDPKKTVTYRVYGPKLLATRKRYTDVATESRCLTFIARENIEARPLFRFKKFLEQAQQIRNKLLMWRFRNFRQLKEKISEIIENPDLFETVYGKEKPDVRSRVLQVILPLALISSEKIKDQLLEFAYVFDERLSELDPDEQLEQAIEEAAVYLLDQMETVPTAQKLRKSRKLRSYREAPKKILLKTLATTIDPDLAKENRSRQLSGFCRKLSSFIRDHLEFPVRKETGNMAFVYFPEYYLKKLEIKKGRLPISTVTSVSSVTTYRFEVIPYGFQPLCEFDCAPPNPAQYYAIDKENEENKRPICEQCKKRLDQKFNDVQTMRSLCLYKFLKDMPVRRRAK
jgi:hypothetical protein